MSAAAKEVLEAAMKLEPTEREQIAHELLQSIDESSNVGFNSSNGLNSTNGLNLSQGLNSTNGLFSTNGLMTTSAGRQTVSYLVKCALPAGRSLVKADRAA